MLLYYCFLQLTMMMMIKLTFLRNVSICKSPLCGTATPNR